MLGIDISKYQLGLDVSKIKKDGFDFIILKIGSTHSGKDSGFDSFYAQAKAAGLKVGAYWYSYATSVLEAQNEAKIALEYISSKTFEMPVYFDIEDSCQRSLGKTINTNMTITFCEKMIAAGYYGGVYTGDSFASSYLNISALSKYSIWIARYGSNNGSMNTKPKNSCDIWQFASNEVNLSCNVNMKSKKLDRNYLMNNNLFANVKKGNISSSSTNASKYDTWVASLQKVLNNTYKSGLVVDGIAGNKTLSATPTLHKGSKNAVVGILQTKLKSLGYYKGSIDNDWGSLTDTAVYNYQKNVVKLSKPDKEFTAKGKSWKKILGLI